MEKDFLPFLSRKQFSFSENTSFGIKIASRANAVGNLLIKGFTKEGTFSFQHTTTGSNAVKEETFFLPDMPIMIMVEEIGDVFYFGTAYAKLTLMLNSSEVYELCQGWIYKGRNLNYPAQLEQISKNTINSPFSRASADPAAGAEITLTVGSNESWKVWGGTFQLVTDATVANRRVHIYISYVGIRLFEAFASVDQTASQTINYTFYRGAGSNLASHDNDILIPIPPDLFLETGMILGTDTVGLVAGDNFGVMTIYCERVVKETP